MNAPAPVDPWVVQAPKQTAQVADGLHLAAFVGVEDFTLPKDGSLKWRFVWSVKSGPEAGKLATALTDRSIFPTTLPGRLIAGLLRRPLQPGEKVKDVIDGCIGQVDYVTVGPGPKGGKSGVKAVNKPPQM